MQPARWIEPLTLTHPLARLEPLAEAHVPGLEEAATDGALWTLWYTAVPAPGETEAWVRTALEEHDAAGACPFAVVIPDTGRVVGSTRMFNVDPANRRLEIGHTWYAASVQRSGVNLACKLILLTHAFDALGAVAVEFRTHWHNHVSRTAIERLGAKQDGVLRRHRILPDGSFRDTVVYSIISDEWPAVRNGLTQRLAR